MTKSSRNVLEVLCNFLEQHEGDITSELAKPNISKASKPVTREELPILKEVIDLIVPRTDTKIGSILG